MMAGVDTGCLHFEFEADRNGLMRRDLEPFNRAKACFAQEQIDVLQEALSERPLVGGDWTRQQENG